MGRISIQGTHLQFSKQISVLSKLCTVGLLLEPQYEYILLPLYSDNT